VPTACPNVSRNIVEVDVLVFDPDPLVTATPCASATAAQCLGSLCAGQQVIPLL
jgi:hypothetical protein